jgi:Dolichyl-phosphate-mannose-protein mannosyltransferase
VSAHAAARRQATALRVAVSADGLATIGLGALFVALAALCWGTWGDLDSDTGFDLVAGARWADGALPYRDFTYYYGPLAPAVVALLSLLGAPSLGGAVGLGLAITALILAATYLLARTLVEPLGAFLATVITAAVAFTPNNYSYVLPHTFAATMGTLLLLGCLLSIAAFARSERPPWLAAAGVSAGLATLTKPETTAAAMAALAAWLVLRRRAGGLAPRHVALLAIPALGIPAAVYGAFLASVSPRELLLENLYPTEELAAGGDTLVRTRMPLNADGLATAAGKGLLYALGAAGLALLAAEMARGGRRGRWLARLALAGAALALLVAAARPDGLRDAFYYAWGWIPIGAVVAVGVAWRRRAQVELAAAVALAVVAASAFAFAFHGWRPSMAVYYAPLAALLLVRLHLVELARSRTAYRLGVAWVAFLAAAGLFLALDEAGRDRVAVRGPGGVLREAPVESFLYQQALGEIQARTRAGEPIFVSPLMTGLYVLSDRHSPLRVISALPSTMSSAFAQQDAIMRMQRAGVRLAITDTRAWPGYGHGAFGETFQRRIANWLQRQFTLVRTIRAPGGERALLVWARPPGD